MSFARFYLAAALSLIAAPAFGQTAAPVAAPVATAADAPWPEAYFEIFKLAPGKQEAFVRLIAQADEVSKIGGQPPIQLYFHEEGDDWDVLLFKPAGGVQPTPAQEAAMAARSKELHLPSGPAYFINLRELVASHTDTKAYGPLSAGQWLARLDAWRADNAVPTTKPSKTK